MHYHAEVWIADKYEAEELVAAAMEPYNEETAKRREGLWDWWVIGGRWSGVHAKIDPTKDPANYEVCFLCCGTGKRRDVVDALNGGPLPPFARGGPDPIFGEDRGAPWDEKKLREYLDEYGCNGCEGTGQTLKHAPNFQPIDSDILPVGEIAPDLTAQTVILPGRMETVEFWNGGDWKETGFDGNVSRLLAKHNITSGYMVTVDYHS